MKGLLQPQDNVYFGIILALGGFAHAQRPSTETVKVSTFGFHRERLHRQNDPFRLCVRHRGLGGGNRKKSK